MSQQLARLIFHLAALAALLPALLGVRAAGAAGPTAHVVLFYSPSCPHCHFVLEQVLPPLQAQYGEQLAVLQVDVSRPDGQELYQAAITTFAIPDNRLGVPTLIIDQTVLVGSEEIPTQLPGLVAAALLKGGNAWSAIPGIEAWLADESAGTAPAEVLSPFQRDPVANTIAFMLLLVMVGSVLVIVFTVRPPFDRPLPAWRMWAVPLLILAGMAVAAYLAFVEVSGSEAVCGPVGDCNTVQQSPYARLFGILPVGVLGVVGYLAMLGAWALRHFGKGDVAHQAAIALPAMAFAGTLFSIYLTFLEPFVIGASCAWCLTSAVLMTALLWLTAPRGTMPVRRGRQQRPAH